MARSTRWAVMTSSKRSCGQMGRPSGWVGGVAGGGGVDEEGGRSAGGLPW
jgi:hypothetical protein